MELALPGYGKYIAHPVCQAVEGMVVTWKRKIAGINLLFQARLKIT